ncbi:YkgJ family cysteine cluster protein [Pseudomonas sp. nanlin1]|uniref:YkgJ family cysteine cluster protein n=1 Tax=Pseudomonas sp. nanlin1 TaxID=3040605 RepID=UPI00388FB746
MNCREGCGACCIAPSISSPLPGMPHGKLAGQRCLHLTLANLCALFGRPERPAVCGNFKADREVCGDSDEEAIRILGWWERMTLEDPQKQGTII